MKRLTPIVWILCAAAALRVFVFSAAFPFFSNVDEHEHFDLVMKYAAGHVPRGLEPFTPETARLIAVYATPEYLYGPESYGGTIPNPLWHRYPPKAVPATDRINHESGEPPLYYALAGLWLRLGEVLGLQGGVLLHWIRFLNVFSAAALVWIGFAVGRTVFPDEPALQLGIPILLAVFPQDTFYSIQSDTLSPVFFGLAFLGLLRLVGADAPRRSTAALTGLALSAALLVKMSNAPFVATAGAAILLYAWGLARKGRLGGALPALLLLVLCAALPAGAWFIRNKVALGNFSGAAAKIAYAGWTPKPPADWWSHPLFSPKGLLTFGEPLLTTFWRGEFVWFGRPLDLPSADRFYLLSSLILPALAALALFRGGEEVRVQRFALLLALSSFMAGVAFLATISIIFDFGGTQYPSHEFPYFVSGRLISGALIPFLVLYVRGIDVALRFSRSARLRLAVLVCIAGAVGLSEIAVNRPAFASAYNFFHMLTYPYSSEGRHNRSLDLAEQKSLDDEAKDYSEILRAKPDDVHAHDALGAILVRQRKFDEAMRHYLEAIRIKPDFDAAHNHLGLALVDQGRLEEAKALFSEAFRINPNQFEAHYNMGVVLSRQGRLDEAAREYSEAIRIKPDYFEAHGNLGATLAQQGKYEEAIRHYSEALSIHPDHERVHYNLGLALSGRGRFEEAVNHFSEAIRLNPRNLPALYQLGIAYEKLEKHDEAVAAFETALRINPDFAEARTKLETIKEK